MKTRLLLFVCGIIFLTPSLIFADQLEMQNGDRYTGKVLSVSANSVVLQNDVLGKITLPRQKVASMAFATNAVSTTPSKPLAVSAPNLSPTNLPNVSSLTATLNGKTNLSAPTLNVATNADVVGQIREQMLSGSPEATAKYNEMATALLSGKMDINDLRREAKSSAEQLRKLKAELGPEADDSIDVYLSVLDNFLGESAVGQTNLPPALKSQRPIH